LFLIYLKLKINWRKTMKKLALLLALMIIPCTAFGLEMLTDNTMDTITGQDGVVIIADDIQLFLNVDLFAYVDTDGYDLHNGCSARTCADGGAMFAVQDLQLDVININAMIATSQTLYATQNPDFSGDAADGNPPLISSLCGIPLFYNSGHRALEQLHQHLQWVYPAPNQGP